VGGTRDNLYSIDAKTSQVYWKFHAVTSIEGIRQTPIVGNGMVYFGDQTGNFYGINITNGSQVWAYPVPFGDGILSSQATLVDQTVYVAFFREIVALDAITGKEKWKTPCIFALKTPTYADGILYADGNQNSDYYLLAAYDAATGKPLWMFGKPANVEAAPPDKVSFSSPVVGKNNVYIGIYQSGLFAIDKKSGATQWVVPVRSGSEVLGVISSPTIADGMVYFGGMDGLLYAVKDQ
jgi:eukaryotic-like serine/threonine-protein kinase